MPEVKLLFILIQISSLLLLTSAALRGNETNRDDLNSIESDFEDKLRATDFKSNLTINNLSLNQLKQLYLKHRVKGQLNFDLINLCDKSVFNSSISPNRTIVFSTYTYVENNRATSQTISTIGYQKTVETMNEITIHRTFEFSTSGGVSIKIPFFKIDIGIHYEASFSEYQSVTKRVTTNETVTAPPQPINVGPFSRVKVTYNIFEYVTTINNRLDFEVTPHAKGLFAFFLKKMGNAVYGQGDLKLEYLDGKAIMRNFPETEQLPSLGIELIIHPEEKIPRKYRENRIIKVIPIV